MDGHRIPIPDAEADRRGLNVVVIDPKAGRVVSGRAYDIWGNPYAENKQLATDIAALPDGHIVLVALKDSGMENADQAAVQALQSVGATVSGPLAMREGYALIGVKGSIAIAERRGSEADIEGVLPCSVQRPLATTPSPLRPGAAQVAQPVSAAPAQPKMPVEPKPQATIPDVEAQVEGQSWEEVLLMLDKLQDQIQAKRLGREVPA